MKKTLLILALCATLASPALARGPRGGFHGGFRGPAPRPAPVMYHHHHHHGGGLVPFIVGSAVGAIAATAIATPAPAPVVVAPPPPPPPPPVVYTAPAPVMVVSTQAPTITRTERVTCTTIVNGVAYQTFKTRIYWSNGTITEN